MRNAFADEITKIANIDKRVMLLSGDIGNKLFDNFKSVDPGRFLNCGIAESNMMGVASGLAMNGLRPIVYTIAPFTTTRCFEQIRMDVCYHEVPVIIVGTGSGLSYAELGPSHHSLEDLTLLRSLPGMQVIAPCDAIELRDSLFAAIRSNKPTYIRIGKKGEPDIFGFNDKFEIGKARQLKRGTDILIITTGTILKNVIEAEKMLEKEGISCQLAHFHTIKPLDISYLEKYCEKFKLIVTVEEHIKSGGLGGVVSEFITTLPSYPRLLRLGTEDEFMHEVGTYEFALQRYGLNMEGIFKKIMETFYK